MKALIYTRPRIKTFFHALGEAISCLTEVHYMSDHQGEEEINIMDYYYQAKRDMQKKGLKPPHDFDFANIVTRCRYLRSLPMQKALFQAKAMTLAIERLIAKYQPDVVFGMVMDSYVLDIFDQVMRTRNSQYLGFLNNMINGYSRLTARGELIPAYEPSETHLEAAVAALQAKHYVPNMQNDFMWNTSPLSMYFTKYMKEKLKIIYYALKKIKDPDNFYYNTVAASHCMSCRSVGQIFFRRFANNQWQERLQDSRAKGQCIIYLPLQFYPECSIDYWGTHSPFANFYAVIEQILANSYRDILILVKEHPSAMGLRKSAFYRSFAKNSQVLLTPFDVPSNEVIAESDLVLTWTGSVGVEAIMRKKPLVTFGEAYYDPGYGILKLECLSQLANLETLLLAYWKETSIDREQLQRDVIYHTLKGLIPGYVFPLDYQSKKNPPKPAQIKELAAGISSLMLGLKTSGPYKVKNGCV